MRGIRLALLIGVTLGSLAACASSSGDGQDGGGDAQATVAGKVRAADGKGVPGCSVVPSLVEGDVGVPEMNVVTKPDGSYTWSLPSGTYNFTVVCDAERDPAVPNTYDGLKGNAKNVDVASGETKSLNIDLS
jgi:hypothetical protein